MRIRILIRQGSYFFIISGIGWCLDFGLYSVLSVIYGVDIAYANMLGAFPAITFVFFMSTRNIFVQRVNGWGVKKKYIVYLLYQSCFILSMSFFAENVFCFLDSIYAIKVNFSNSLIKIIVKCLITPITMVMNFIVVKFLSEKI